MVACSRFRYSAPSVPWLDAELNRLHLKWIGLAKVAWKVHPGFPAAPFKFPTTQAGSPVQHPRVYHVLLTHRSILTAARSVHTRLAFSASGQGPTLYRRSPHIEQLVALPDELRDRTIRLWGRRRPRECPIATLLRACEKSKELREKSFLQKTPQRMPHCYTPEGL